ncbi:MAG: ligase-associated DNA damage response endonuclease PdeM, partial [Pseudomonadota bacterium]
MAAAANVQPDETRIHLAGQWVFPLAQGALWWPDQQVLVVSDLHLEKGSSYARRGQMLPPYDTGATLSVVETLCAQLRPGRVISLGDSFHDRGAEVRLSEADTARIQALTGAHDWVWVEGNHDPDPPQHLGGRATKTLEIGGLVFRHEPTGERGEVAGHLHPGVRLDDGRAIAGEVSKAPLGAVARTAHVEIERVGHLRGPHETLVEDNNLQRDLLRLDLVVFT